MLNYSERIQFCIVGIQWKMHKLSSFTDKWCIRHIWYFHYRSIPLLNCNHKKKLKNLKFWTDLHNSRYNSYK